MGWQLVVSTEQELGLEEPPSHLPCASEGFQLPSWASFCLLLTCPGGWSALSHCGERVQRAGGWGGHVEVISASASQTFLCMRVPWEPVQVQIRPGFGLVAAILAAQHRGEA